MVVLSENLVKGKTRQENLEDVKALNLWGQDLSDVSVLLKMPGVEVLSLSVNKITSLKDFRNCLKLQELYLRKNEVASLHEIQYLMPLKELKVLWLIDNPCANSPLYRPTVIRALPSLQKLDNQEISPLERETVMRNQEGAQFLPSSVKGETSAVSSPKAASSSTSQYVNPSSSEDRSNPKKNKNILYAVMALISELDDEDLGYVHQEIKQRMQR